MRAVGTVAEIFRYPVKSMLGESLEATVLDALGVAGDRVWALRDEKRGDHMTGKRVAVLMSCAARTREGGAPEITLPDGTGFPADAPDASERLAAALGRKVTLCRSGAPAPPEDAADREEVADPAADFESIFVREKGERVPDFSSLPAELLGFLGREDKPFVDLSPLLLLSRQSVDAIRKAAPESKIDVRRFRPSLLLDLPDAGAFPEQAWVGRRVRIGEAELSTPMTCPRCVMTTHGFADLTVMRRLVSEAEGNLGVYATVTTPGNVRVGDAIELLD